MRIVIYDSVAAMLPLDVRVTRRSGPEPVAGILGTLRHPFRVLRGETRLAIYTEAPGHRIF